MRPCLAWERSLCESLGWYYWGFSHLVHLVQHSWPEDQRASVDPQNKDVFLMRGEPDFHQLCLHRSRIWMPQCDVINQPRLQNSDAYFFHLFSQTQFSLPQKCWGSSAEMDSDFKVWGVCLSSPHNMQIIFASLHILLLRPLLVFVVVRVLPSHRGATGVICNHFKNALEVFLAEGCWEFLHSLS